MQGLSDAVEGQVEPSGKIFIPSKISSDDTLREVESKLRASGNDKCLDGGVFFQKRFKSSISVVCYSHCKERILTIPHIFTILISKQFLLNVQKFKTFII